MNVEYKYAIYGDEIEFNRGLADMAKAGWRVRHFERNYNWFRVLWERIAVVVA